MASNTLMHREFSSSYTAKFVIEKERMYIENANRAMNDGFITIDNLEPNPKNPIIAAFFRNIGYADQLGSGVRNLFKYSKFYSGAEPSFVEGDVFRIIVPLDDAYSFDFNYTKNKTYEPKNEPNEPKKEWDLGLSENEKQLLNYIEDEATITQKELSEKMNISISTVKRNLFKLKEKGLLIHEGNKRSGKWIILKEE